jgi:hypothetical protein
MQTQEKLEKEIIIPRNDGTQAEIKKIIAAQFLDQLLAESGNSAIDWQSLCHRAAARAEATPTDDFEQGYWVDINNVLAPDRIAGSMAELEAGLPADVRDGLNWAPDKTFFFIVSVLDSSVAPAEVEHGFSLYEDDEEAGEKESDMGFEELRERKAAALVVARNSVVATWLWRRFAESTPLAGNSIQIDPWWGAIGIETENTEPGEGV